MATDVIVKVCATCRYWTGHGPGFGECIHPTRQAPMITGHGAVCPGWTERYHQLDLLKKDDE